MGSIPTEIERKPRDSSKFKISKEAADSSPFHDHVIRQLFYKDKF